MRLDLNKLKLDKMSVKNLNKPKIVKLPKMETEVELRPLNLRDLFESLKIVKDN